MILFIFEGDDREPQIYKTLERLYFPKANDRIICSFGNNIYDLYQKMTAYKGYGDIVAVMQELLAQRGDTTLAQIRSTDIAEIFLFFDYDFHHAQLSMEEIHRRVEQMLRMFDNETDNGLLYINYPMLESLVYTKELPDEEYRHYVVRRADCRGFKRLAHEFSFYANFDHLLFKKDVVPTKEQYLRIREHWQYLLQMNVYKAHELVTNRYALPTDKSIISQLAIFGAQRAQYVDVDESVAVLNSFPLFLYDYFE